MNNELEKIGDCLAYILQKMPPLGETDIQNIKNNPTLSIVSKIRLIRQIRKGMKYKN